MASPPTNYVLRGVFWTAVYLVLVLAPLFVLILRPIPGGNGLLYDFSMALGFAAAAMMAVMFLLTARFKRPAAPFGIDIIYYFHRQVSLAALLFVLAHPLLLVAVEPAFLDLLHPRRIPRHLLAGVLSAAAFLGIMTTSLWRKRISLPYDSWRLWHAVLAVAALALAILHIQGAGQYVNAPWKKLFWVAIPLSCTAVLIWVRLVKPWHLRRHPWRVAEVVPERGDSWSLILEPEGHGGIDFLPGQFAWITLWSSPFAMREHPFSFSSSAERPRRIRFTIKELGDFTARIKEVRPGQRAFVDAPYGSFSIDRHPAPGFVFIAGGIGIAPVVGMLRTLADRGDGRPILLIYGYSSWERLTFREELAELEERLDLRTVVVLQEPPEGWEGESGLLTEELLHRHLPTDPGSREYFICGPVPMIDVAEKACHRLGVPLRHIQSELFDLV